MDKKQEFKRLAQEREEKFHKIYVEFLNEELGNTLSYYFEPAEKILSAVKESELNDDSYPRFERNDLWRELLRLKGDAEAGNKDSLEQLIHLATITTGILQQVLGDKSEIAQDLVRKSSAIPAFYSMNKNLLKRHVIHLEEMGLGAESSYSKANTKLMETEQFKVVGYLRSYIENIRMFLGDDSAPYMSRETIKKSCVLKLAALDLPPFSKETVGDWHKLGLRMLEKEKILTDKAQKYGLCRLKESKKYRDELLTAWRSMLE